MFHGLEAWMGLALISSSAIAFKVSVDMKLLTTNILMNTVVLKTPNGFSINTWLKSLPNTKPHWMMMAILYPCSQVMGGKIDPDLPLANAPASEKERVFCNPIQP